MNADDTFASGRTGHRHASMLERRATIEDVASAAKVSVATVSRALRGLPNVAVSTRQRVMSVATSLNYEPDPAASRLAAGKTKTVTVGVPLISGWYFSTVVASAEAVCNGAGYDFQVICVSGPADRDRLLDDRHHLERRTDGLILVDVEPSAEQAARLRSRRIALTTIGNAVDGHPSVMIDDELVGEMACEHLVELGHRRIAMIGGLHDDPMNFTVPKRRRQGFERTLVRHGLALLPEFVAVGNFGIQGGREAMAELLDLADPPTAVFAMSDDMAFGALMELDRHGLVAGRDISIVGVDDHEFAQVVNLTTIRQPVADHGAVAAQLLISEMEAAAVGATGRPLTGTPTRSQTGESAGTPAVRGQLALVVRSTTGPAPV
ncbi:MAG: LacI family DNA-binding transcriptional regulator [Ilumatobacter sp.]|uniref:LacI family DNA-binding transcriptional regulator n=1 Tax=Ilumatobacter sp. TaxID=1967498 RepID=UPI00391DFE9F